MGKIILITVVCFLSASVRGQQLNACDLNSDGTVNAVDIQLAVNMALGKAACTAQVYGNVCNIVVVQRVVNAVLGKSCITGNHYVTLSWGASTSSGVTGYKVYRGTSAGGPYTLVQSSTTNPALSWVDRNVTSGATYYYVVTAISPAGESVYSNEATAAIPNP